MFKLVFIFMQSVSCVFFIRVLKVLPSYGVIPVFGALSGLGGMPGVEINFAMVLHGEQELVSAAWLAQQGR